MTYDLRGKSSFEILEFFASLALAPKERFSIELLEETLLRLGYASFIDIAQLHAMRFLTPTCHESIVTLHFEKLDTEASFHNQERSNEKYGVASEFFTINKNDKLSFLYNYQKALQFCGVKRKKRILNLGINRGDEFLVIKEMLGEELCKSIEFVGVDYCPSAIEVAKQTFQEPNFSFYAHDIKELLALELGKFDLIISIGTLQSSNLNFNETLMQIYQNSLAEDGAMLLGFPNCRWIDGEMLYGAKAPNYSFSEMSLLVKDIHFCKKYLQQKKYRVVVSGKDYIFLSARR
jgi:hypothetical protein